MINLKQKSYLNESKKKFELTTLNDGFFARSNPVNCACYYKYHLIIGTDSGLFVGIHSDSNATPLSGSYVNLSFVKVSNILFKSF